VIVPVLVGSSSTTVKSGLRERIKTREPCTSKDPVGRKEGRVQARFATKGLREEGVTASNHVGIDEERKNIDCRQAVP